MQMRLEVVSPGVVRVRLDAADAADFEEIGQMIRGARHYFLQSFTDRDTVPFGGFSAHTPEDLRRFAEIVRKYADDVQLRGVE